ncbi:MAG: hypothetical protein WCI67_19030 [Chloroflexales bacterium]
MTTSAANAIARHYLPWLAAIAGALLIIALSSITTIADASPPAEATDIELTLGGIKTVAQTFVINQPDLAGLAIRLRPAAAGGPDTKISVHLRYADGPPFDLVIGDAIPSAARDGVLTLRFPAITVIRDPRVPTTTLRLTLGIPKLRPNTGPFITVRPNPQSQGGLVIDRSPTPRQGLVIVPIYQRRWADQLWPISALARGKPGLLGWPPLYPLLAYAYLIMIAAGSAALRRTLRPQDN